MFKRLLLAVIVLSLLAVAACDEGYIPVDVLYTEMYLTIEEEIEEAAEEGVKEVEEAEEIEETTTWELEPFVVEFITLPNGTRADTRLLEVEIDLILRHFAAIEDGDVEAFQDTLIGGQYGIRLSFWRYLTFRYFNDWFLENDLSPEDFYHRTRLPSLRGTGLFVREIDVLEQESEWGWWNVNRALRALVVNDYGFERTFIFGSGVHEHRPESFIIGPSPAPDFNITWMPEALVADFINRYYPTVFMSREEQAAICLEFLESDNPSARPRWVILLDNPVIAYSADWHQTHGLTIVLQFYEPYAGTKSAATRMYKFDVYDNVFRIIEDSIR